MLENIFMPKPRRDALLIIHFGIDRSIDTDSIKWLESQRLITPKHGGGWMTTSKGRDYVNAIKRAT
jgi:hypothetical protein